MRRKLFFYMLTLAVIVIAFLAMGLFFLGHFSTAKETASNNLSFQMKTFDRQVSGYFSDLSRMGSALSESLTKMTDEFLMAKRTPFEDLNDDVKTTMELHDKLFDKLGQELMKTDCSGAFFLMNSTVKTSNPQSYTSKSGVYLQRYSIDKTDERLLLFRGITQLAEKRGIEPHRKWRQEFRTDEIADYDKFTERVKPPIDRKPFLTSISVLTGTSEKVLCFIVPMVGDYNVVYGFCGFEISELYFKSHFAQPSQLDHLTCMLFPGKTDVLKSADGFSAGVYGGYYLPPRGEFSVDNLGNGIVSLTSSDRNSSYVAKIQPVKLCDDDYILTVAYPKSEYDRAIANNVFSVVSLVLLLVGATVIVSVFFSNRFLSPLLKGIEQIHSKEHKNAKSAFIEIDDLFAFLAEQDRLHEEETEKLRTRCDEQGDLIEQNQADIEKLKYSRKNEISPDDYEMFKIGLTTLTKTEKTIFQLYLDGKDAYEIMDICRIQKGTLKYHNHNILGKLGVSSRKQMLRYALLLKQESEETL